MTQTATKSTEAQMVALLREIQTNGNGKIAAFPGNDTLREIVIDCAAAGYLDPCWGGMFQLTDAGRAVVPDHPTPIANRYTCIGCGTRYTYRQNAESCCNDLVTED